MRFAHAFELLAAHSLHVSDGQAEGLGDARDAPRFGGPLDVQESERRSRRRLVALVHRRRPVALVHRGRPVALVHRRRLGGRPRPRPPLPRAGRPAPARRPRPSPPARLAVASIGAGSRPSSIGAVVLGRLGRRGRWTAPAAGWSGGADSSPSSIAVAAWCSASDADRASARSKSSSRQCQSLPADLAPVELLLAIAGGSIWVWVRILVGLIFDGRIGRVDGKAPETFWETFRKFCNGCRL